jgi:hypothetical protein
MQSFSSARSFAASAGGPGPVSFSPGSIDIDTAQEDAGNIAPVTMRREVNGRFPSLNKCLTPSASSS